MLAHPKIANNITDLIGRTPLLRLNKINPSGNAEILLKLESMEPCSSVKVKSALLVLVHPACFNLLRDWPGNDFSGSYRVFYDRRS